MRTSPSIQYINLKNVDYRKPDFYIVGAPKCGTTSMFESLIQHPNVFSSIRKEFYFFGSDLGMSRLNKKEYLEYFLNASEDEIIGEASTWYLYSNTAAEEIRNFSKSSRIIIMLRNPIEMVHSLHSQLVFSGDETCKDFEKAIYLEEQRKKGKALPNSKRLPVQCFFYSDIGKYTSQVQRYINTFGLESIHLIIFDDFKDNLLGEYQKTLQFLHIDPTFTPYLGHGNPNKEARIKLITRFLRNPPDIVNSLSKKILPSNQRETIIRFLWRLNSRYSNRKPLSPQIESYLKNIFKQDVVSLSMLINRDLTSWVR